MKRLALGIIGHVDHGKTALVRALTGMDTDRLPEEKRRGISIALGFAFIEIDGLPIDIIDMPGHERFVRTMVSGATGISAVLLVVAADEGIKPQTVEHAQIAALLGIRQAIVIVSKADLADRSRAEAVGTAAAELARGLGMAAGGPVHVSAATGLGLDDTRKAISNILRTSAQPSDCGFPYLPVDRAFSIAGHGTVVTGTLRRGGLAAGTELAILPRGETVRVRRLQIHGLTVERAEPGQRVAVNLRDIEPAQVPRGAALAGPHVLDASSWLTVRLQSVAEAPPLGSGMHLRLLLGTDEAAVRLRLLDRDELSPACTAFAQLRCERPVYAPARERFILRTDTPAATVAGGIVLDPCIPRLRRHSSEVLQRLDALGRLDGPELIEDEVARSGMRGISLVRLSQIGGLSQQRVRMLLNDLPVVLGRSGIAVMRDTFGRLVGHLPHLIERQTAGGPIGLPRQRLREYLPETSPEVAEEAVAKAIALGRIRQEGGFLHVAHPDRDRERAERETALAAQVAEIMRQAGLTPPNVADVLPGENAQKIVSRLVHEGVLVRTIDRVQKREILFHQDAIAAAQHYLMPLLDKPPGLLVKDIGAALGISRKYSVPLLEYLDAIRFTRRVGDRRILGRSP